MQIHDNLIPGELERLWTAQHCGLREIIRERTDRHFKQLGEALRSALSSTKNSGQIPDVLDLDEGVAFLLDSTMGIRIIIRKAASIESAQPIVDMPIKTIRAWCTKSKTL